MAFFKHEQVVIEVEEEEDYSDNGSDPDYDSDMDPSYCIVDETRGKFSNLSIKKNQNLDPEETKVNVGEIDERSFEQVQKIIEAGKLEKLKVEQCKVYLRKNGLRLTGNKDTLIQRIKEHQEILNGGEEEKYPISSFVLNCKGDACMGDVVMFEQNVYEMYNIASRSASGPPCGTRVVAGQIVKESYGASKQQHTFTIEVLWSKGDKPLPPLHPLLIKGRNLYKLKTLRQRWEDEEERSRVLMEKHSRGSLARFAREARIQEKERRKLTRENRDMTKEERNSNQSQLKSTSKANQGIEAQQSGSSVNCGKATLEPLWSKSTTEARISGMSVDALKMGGQPQKLATQPHSGMGSGTQHLHLMVDSFKPTNQSPQQPSISVETLLAFQPELQNQRGHGNYNQFPHNLVGHTGIQEVQHHHPPLNKYPNTTWKNGFSERYHHRQPLTSMNHHHPMSLLNRQGYQQQKLCKFYAQGRCIYGDNCKFLHDLKGPYGQEGKRGGLTVTAG